MKLFSLALLISISNLVFSQIKSRETTIKEGEKYYVHTVEKGSTLYSISKLYGVSMEVVIRLNPGIEHGLREDKILLIPFKDEVTHSQKTVKEPVLYKVREGETLFSISKKIGVNPSEIKHLNPNLGEVLLMDQEILVPNTGVDVNAITAEPKKVPDTIIDHVVLDHETLYSISKRFMVSVNEVALLNKISSRDIKPGMILKVPVYPKENKEVNVREIPKSVSVNTKEDTLKKQDIRIKDSLFRVAFVLPFNSDKENDALSLISTEFYMGAQIALDSLAKLGYSCNVSVYDCGTDTTTLVPILEKIKEDTFDLIIGPLNGQNLEYTADFCKNNYVKMVSPIVNSTSVLLQNPFVYNASTSDISLVKGLAKFIYKNYVAEQIILVKVGPKDEELFSAFRSSFMSQGTRKLFEISDKEISAYSKKGKNCVYVVLSREKAYSTMISNEIMMAKDRLGSPMITLFGLKDWLSFEDIDGETKNKLNFHFANSVDYSEDSQSTIALESVYENKFNVALTKYAIQGFDVSMYFIKSLFNPITSELGVMNHLNVVQTKEGSGFENKACFIFKQEDFEILKVGEINN